MHIYMQQCNLRKPRTKKTNQSKILITEQRSKMTTDIYLLNLNAFWLRSDIGWNQNAARIYDGVNWKSINSDEVGWTKALIVSTHIFNWIENENFERKNEWTKFWKITATKRDWKQNKF